MQKTCEHCAKEYEAKRAASKYCSDVCRKQANRNDAPTTTDPHDEWFNSAETKTYAERMAHYNYENFPKLTTR